MKKTILAAVCLFAMAAGATAQSRPDNKPAAGSWAVGLSMNVLGIGSSNSQPGNNSGAADFVSSNSAFVSEQMNIITQDPLARISFKYFKSDKFAIRFGVGFSGSNVNYKEYVQDDLAKFQDSESEDVVFDIVHGTLGTFSANLGGEYRIGKGNVQMILGFGVGYVLGGGGMTFDYGNVLTAANTQPSTIGMADKAGELNQFNSPKQGIDWARPTTRFTEGVTHAVNISADLGVEWFFIKNASLQASVGIVPVTFAFQPQTWAEYEGYSTKSMRVEKYNDLISPGSNAVLFGTNNISLNIGLNYYF